MANASDSEHVDVATELREAVRLLDYDLRAISDKACDRMLWEANMASHKIILGALRSLDCSPADHETPCGKCAACAQARLQADLDAARIDLDTMTEQVEKSEAERDRARDPANRYQGEMYKAEDSLAVMTVRAKKAESAAAAMREALQEVHNEHGRTILLGSRGLALVEPALASDSGSSLLTERDQLRRALDDAVQRFTALRDWILNYQRRHLPGYYGQPTYSYYTGKTYSLPSILDNCVYCLTCGIINHTHSNGGHNDGCVLRRLLESPASLGSGGSK